MVRQTSIETYNQIKKGQYFTKTRWEAYDLLFKYGPLTASELYAKAKEVMGNPNLRDNHQKRLPELREMGVVVELGTKICSETGRNVILWDVTDRLPVKLGKKPTTKESKKVLIQKIEELKQSISPEWRNPVIEIWQIANSI